MIELPYGRVRYALDLGDRAATIVSPPPLPPPRAVPALIAEALDRPIGQPQLERLVQAGAHVTVIVSDGTRAEPRSEFLAALRARLTSVRWTLAIATGTHGPSALDGLGLPPWVLAEATLVNHDGHRADNLVDLGTTARGTPVRVHRCVLDADLVIATGCIRPHYFAGFGAGVKAIFPGLGEASAIRVNHAHKSEPGARAGVVHGNPCREDLEEAGALVPTPVFLVNGVAAPDGKLHAVVAGDPRAAFRVGAALARAWFTVRAARAPVVVASDALPVAGSLYQAAKIAAAVAPLVAEDGVLVVAAECPDGIGPLEVVNEAIFRIGVLPRLPRGASIRLVSALAPDLVARTLLQHARTIEEVVHAAPGPVLVIPRASQLITEALS